jgi:hypothetical protein
MIASRGLAFWAVSIATRVIQDSLVRTVVALFEARAESGGTTGADVMEYFALSSGQRVSLARKELLFVLTKDIGHFQPMLCHDCGSESPVLSIDFSCRASKGLRTACRRWIETCR